MLCVPIIHVSFVMCLVTHFIIRRSHSRKTGNTLEHAANPRKNTQLRQSSVYETSSQEKKLPLPACAVRSDQPAATNNRTRLVRAQYGRKLAEDQAMWNRIGRQQEIFTVLCICRQSSSTSRKRRRPTRIDYQLIKIS